MTGAQAGKLLELLKAAHPRTELPDATADLWLGELRKLDHAVGEAAVYSLVESVMGWPSVAHLKAAVQVASEQAARVRRDAERHDAERAFDELPHPRCRRFPRPSN
jgi:hypothetical protein